MPRSWTIVEGGADTLRYILKFSSPAKRYRQIKSVLRVYKKGRTAKQIAVIMYKKGVIPTAERNFTAPRLTELVEKGEVEPIGKTLCEYTGKKVTVYALRREA